MMKKILISIFAAVLTTAALAQSAADALTISQDQYEGTARSLALGNAMVSLGGDLGAISINPAGSGVFRHSQFSVTPGLSIANSTTDYLGDVNKKGNTRFSFANGGVVFAFDTGNYSGLLNWNIGVVYNRRNNFHTNMYSTGLTDETSFAASMAASLEGIHSYELEGSGCWDVNASWPAVLSYGPDLVPWDADERNKYAYLSRTLNVLDVPKYEGVDDLYIGATENYDEDTDEKFVAGNLEQTHTMKTFGGVQEFTLNFGSNFSDFVYAGISFNCLSVNYTLVENFTEYAADSRDFQSGFYGMQMDHQKTVNGAGFNIKGGVIVTPADGLRLGATVSTPSWYSLTDNEYWCIYSEFDTKDWFEVYSPTRTYSYRMSAPWRWSLGASYVFGDKALVSLDYENVNYRSMKFKENGRATQAVAAENQYIKDFYRNSSILRAGVEIWPIEQLAVRLGYNLQTSAGEGYNAINQISAGLGWRINRILGLDLAWSKRLPDKYEYTLYPGYQGLSSPVGLASSTLDKVLLTLSCKF